MKRGISFLLVLSLVLPCLPLGALATEMEPSGVETVMETTEAVVETMEAIAEVAETSLETGVCGDNLTWTLDKMMGVLTISGVGAMADYPGSGYVGGYPSWYQSLRPSIKQIVIESGVTSIGDHVFSGCSYSSSISIPETVTSIGKRAFQGCSALTELSLPKGLKTIGYSAFINCSKLTEMIIPSGVTEIDDYTFRGCTRLAEVSLPGNLASIGDHAFENCRKLTQIAIPASVRSIGEGAFQSSGITSIVIPEGITLIEENAFYECESLAEITLPSSLTSIGYNALALCDNLKDVYYNDTKQNWYAMGLSLPSSNVTLHCAGGDDDYLCGDNLTWTLDESGTLTISGTGGMWDFSMGDGLTAIYVVPWKEYLDKITTVIVNEGVTSLSNNAFRNCTNLTKIKLPSSITYMEGSSNGRGGNGVADGSPFIGCTNIKTAGPIGSGCDFEFAWTSEILDNAFLGLGGLKSVMLPQTVTRIGRGAFEGCSKLQSITIPTSVTSIDSYAFARTGIQSIIIRTSAVTVGSFAFDRIYHLTDVYFAGTEADWEHFVENNVDNSGRWGTMGNQALLDATIHCNGSSSMMVDIENPYPNFYLFRGDPNIYNMEYPDDASYAELSTIVKKVGSGSPGDIRWISSDENILTITPTGALVPDFVGHTLGTATVTASNAMGENISFPVTVLRPNKLSFETIHDSRQFYYDGGFYSEESQFSDCVEIFWRFENQLVVGYPCKVPDPTNSSVSIAPITLTAQVSGENLSFDRETYQNTYTRTYDAISLESSLAELLMLFPLDYKVLKPGDVYSVCVTAESESFEKPITVIHVFTICDAALTTVGAYAAFATSNNSYLVSKGNHYGQNMAGLKEDPEYWWSKWTSFDFENYYEVVIADLMIGVLNVQQKQNFSLMPKVLKEWGGNFKKLAKGIDEVIKADFELDFDIGESDIDKIFKMSKYDKSFVNNDNLREDAIYQFVMDTFSKPEHQKKLHKVFQGIDDIKQISGLTSIATDFYKEFRAWGNTITLMNAYHQADEEMKLVVKEVLSRIPLNAESQFREAIESYVNYDSDVTGQAMEIFDAFLDSAAKISYDTFNSVWSKKIGSVLGTKLLGFIGNISIKGGVKIAETTIFQALGPLSTGVSIGLFVSDLICDSSDKAAEMGKIIAMADYAPYFIKALDYYEDMMLERKTLDSVALFETAFQLHQSVQSYIMDHTYNLLILKAESLIQIIRGNDEYYDVAADVLLYKNKVDNMRCCNLSTMDGTTVRNANYIAIKCPVDVSLYAEDGTEVVRIRSNVLEYAADGITVCILDSEKHMVVAADQEYSVRILSTDLGTMDYVVSEYGDDLTLERTVLIEDIPLTKNQEFFGKVSETMGAPVRDFVLTSGEKNYVPEKEGTVLWGDADGNGVVNTSDARLVLQRYVGIVGEDSLNLRACDVDGNGGVNTSDARLILQCYVGIIAKFPIEINS